VSVRDVIPVPQELYPRALPLVAFGRMFLAGIHSGIQEDSGLKAQIALALFNLRSKERS
jgi:hypothetical protein